MMMTDHEKTAPRSGFSLDAQAELLQLGFLVLDMLAGFGIKFHDRHFFGHGFLVLAGGVEVTGTCRRFKLDFFASAFGSHGEILSVCDGWRSTPVGEGQGCGVNQA